MMEMKEFQEKLSKIITKAISQDKNLSNEEILETFGENQLNTQQLQSLYEYLRIQGIRIQGVDLQAEELRKQVADMEIPEEVLSVAEEENVLIPLETEDEVCCQEYRDYIKMMPPEKEGEREDLLAQYAQGKKHVQERLAQIYLPEILKMARTLYQKGIFLADLIQEGNMSLLTVQPEAIPQEKADIWMQEQIKEGMKDWIALQTEQKLQDEYMVEKVRKLEAAIKELSDDDNQKFSIEEISAFLDMEVDEIQAVLNLTGEGQNEK